MCVFVCVKLCTCVRDRGREYVAECVCEGYACTSDCRLQVILIGNQDRIFHWSRWEGLG